MTNATLSAIYSVLSTVEFENKDAIMADLSKDINRYAERKAQKASEYEQAKGIVFDIMRTASNPLTVAEIFEKCSQYLPDGFTKSKVQYGLTHYWMDEVVVTKDKVNAYALKA